MIHKTPLLKPSVAITIIWSWRFFPTDQKMISNELDIVTDTYQSSVKRIAKDLFYLNRKHEYVAPFKVVDAFGHFSIYAHGHIRPGELCIKANGQSFTPAGTISMFIPKLSLVQWDIVSPHLEWHAYVSDQDFAPQFKEPTVFADCISVVNSISDISAWLKKATPLNIFSQQTPVPLAVEIKNYMDAHFQLEIEISEIAEKFNLSDSQLTKIFKNEFNISPVKYRSKIRVFQSMFDLFSKDGSVIDIALDTGFNDLSRFNKQFKTITKTTPSKFKFQPEK